jgi:hypothetical protein
MWRPSARLAQSAISGDRDATLDRERLTADGPKEGRMEQLVGSGIGRRALVEQPRSDPLPGPQRRWACAHGR